MTPILGIIASSRPKVFTPLSLPNLKGWYDASDTSSISVSSTKVTQWNDKSGNAKHLVQATDSYRPISGTRTVNSLNVIDYDSNVKSLANSDRNHWQFMSDTTGATIFYAYKLDAAASGDPYWMMVTRGGSVAGGPGFAHFASTSDKWQNAVNNTSGNIVSNTSTSSIGTATVCWTCLSDPNNGTAANRSDLRKNAGSAEKNNTLTGTPGTELPNQGLRIGDYIQGGTLSMNAVVCEIVICSGLLGATDITKAQNYLIAKWGI